MSKGKASFAARCLICVYFANQVYEQRELYTQEMRDNTAKFPERYPPVPFPDIAHFVAFTAVLHSLLLV